MQPVAGLAPVVGAVHPGQTAALRVQWMRASLDATIVWNDVDRADALQGRIADGEMTAEMQIVFTDLMAVAARLHDRNEDWPGVAATYSDQMHMTTGERQARMLHNAGVAFIMAGQLAEGENLLRQAMTIDASAADLARINLFAAGIDGIDLAPLVTSEHPQTRMLALGLAITAARGAAERKRLEAEFRTARARQCRESVHARVLPGPAGIVLRGSVRVDLGMSTADGLQLQLDTTSEPWLLVSSAYAAPLAHPCPTDRASARRATTRPRGAGRDSHP